MRRKARVLDFLVNYQAILSQNPEDPDLQELLRLRGQLSLQVFYQPQTLSTAQHRTQLATLQSQVDAHEQKLRQRYLNLLSPSAPLQWQAIQATLPTDATLIEIVRYQPVDFKGNTEERFGAPRYAAYWLSREGIPRGIDLGEAQTIDLQVKALRQELTDRSLPDEEQVKQVSRKLDALVMAPVRQHLGTKTQLILSPAGKLNLIPFEVLVDEQNQYLVENYRISYLSAGRDIAKLQNPASETSSAPVLVGDPVFNQSAIPDRQGIFTDSSESASGEETPVKAGRSLAGMTLTPLSATKTEIEGIKELLPDAQTLLDKTAREQTLKQMQSPQILHIATHGIFLSLETQTQESTREFLEQDDLLRSLLVLTGVRDEPDGTDDGILTAAEVLSMNLRGTELVVLSACDTGVGSVVTWEGVYGLRRAFAIAGSRTQALSLWRVGDDSTKDLILAYYRQVLQKGAGRGEALRQVQLAMMKGEGFPEQYKHPSFWSSFIISGDWRPLQSPSP